MPREKWEIESARPSKGFTRRQSYLHYFVYVTMHQGQQSRAHTKPSHTPKMEEISNGLLGNAASYEPPDPTHDQCWLMAGFESKGKARAFSRTTSSRRGVYAGAVFPVPI